MLDKNYRIFIITWLGQFVSVLGSRLTSFALGVWVVMGTGSATQFSLILFCATLPGVLLAPLGGALVDRWDRRWAMILSDTGSGLCTLIFTVLIYFDHLEVWHICLLSATSSFLSAFQWPAYAATISLLIPKKHLGRVSGMMQLGRALPQVIGPALAGFLLIKIDIRGVFIIDFATYLFALGTLMVVRFPKPKVKRTKSGSTLLSEIKIAWQFIFEKAGTRSLLVFFATISLTVGFYNALITPLILSFETPDTLGNIVSLSGVGMLIGGIIMSLWGGPKRLMHGVLSFGLVLGLGVFLTGLRPSALLIGIAAFLMMGSVPIVNGCTQAILQTKTPPELQGRVFSLGGMLTSSSMLVAFLVAGPLADYVFKPLLTEEGPLAATVGPWLGVGEGRGIGLLYLVIAAAPVVASLKGLSNSGLRLLEDELPDAIGKEEKREEETPKP